MKTSFLTSILGLMVVLLPVSSNGQAFGISHGIFHHDLKVILYPEKHRLRVEDRITVPDHSETEVSFLLHGGLEPSISTPGAKLSRERGTYEGISQSFRVRLSPGVRSFVLTYGGSIYHQLDSGQATARGFSSTPGVISAEGVYLSGSSFWYPVIRGAMVSFSLSVEMPPAWDAVSQGRRSLHTKQTSADSVKWDSPEPQEEIFLVASRFTEYERPGRVTSMVFLRSPDEKLAAGYLEATGRYIAMYERLIGPYPYEKFALVENFWETGFGMPSFTLLGPKVIRLPFIITSSYPHEILHNWWGNGVFPDYREGNWSEGLTAYLSDHLLKEQQGAGAEYRLETLQKYADYVTGGRDFPLTSFISRHSSSSEAVGYGKSLMFFHMLRRELGDRAFTEGLRLFYRNFKFRFASFDDLRGSFEKASGKDLALFFRQWVTRTGAPGITMKGVGVKREGSNFIVTGLLEQTQSEKTYVLKIPVAVTMEGVPKAYQTVVEMKGKRLNLHLALPSRPLRVDIDPEFDVFRRLDREEVPPALSEALGAKRILVILPSSANKEMARAYRDLSNMLSVSGQGRVEVKSDRDISQIPRDRAIFILGWENRFAANAAADASPYGVTFHERSVKIGKTEIPKKNHSVVLVSSTPRERKAAVVFIASDSVGSLPGLGAKIPHYHKYSYLAFEGDEPSNILKGRWPVTRSPLTTLLPDKDGKASHVDMGALAPRPPLSTLPASFSAEDMMSTVRYLSDAKLQGRGFGSRGLDEAAEYIAAKFREAGLLPGGDGEGSYFETWEERGGDPERTAVMKNVIGIIPGTKNDLSGQSVVVGAHYDHLGLGWPDVRGENKGKVHPGADDNASGVAVLIGLANVLAKGIKPNRAVVFVAFTGEEAGKRGSQFYVSHEKRYPVDKCVGMLNLDTVGRLDRKKLLVIDADSAKEWVHIVRGAGFETGVEVDAVSERLDSSDQMSFEEAGVPAVQLFSGPHADYHRPSDTADKIDAEGLVKVASVAEEVVLYLAGRDRPLTSALRPGKEPGPEEKRERKVSFGTIPDFSFKGNGYRLSGVVAGSPAEIAGLKTGDVIIKINSREVKNLKDISDILKSLEPGSRISITFLREGNEMKVETTLTQK